MAFGIDNSRVYADDGNTNPAFWTVFPGHVHAQVVQALQADTAVQVAVKAKLAAPNDAAKRGASIDLINRATANCIGQHILGQALHPAQAAFTLYNLLAEGTAADIDTIIGAAANGKLHQAFADQNVTEVITVISRQTGRALFQTCLSQLTDLAVTPQNLVSKLKKELEDKASGIVPGIG